MKIAPAITPKLLVATITVILLFVGFNAFQPPLESVQEAAFNKWYEQHVAHGTQKPSLQSDATLSTITVSVSVYEIRQKNVVASWSIPRPHATPMSDYDMLLRVLQLIRESNLFHLKPDTRSSGEGLSISISIKTPQQSFQTTIPMESAQESIQLKNLLKLLETHDSLPPPQTVYPTSRL